MLGVGGGNVARNGSEEQPIPAGGGPLKCPTGAGLLLRPPQSDSLGALLCPELLVPTHAWGGYQLPS